MKLDLKIPPPLQMLIFGILMWVVGRRLSGGQFDFDSQLVSALLLTILGLAINVLAIIGFRRASTTVNPLDPGKASHLVVDGIFRFSRNPMYFGILIVLFAWAIWIGNVYNLVLLALFVYIISKYQIKPEEEALRSLFGKTYVDYCSRVRRWI